MEAIILSHEKEVVLEDSNPSVNDTIKGKTKKRKNYAPKTSGRGMRSKAPVDKRKYFHCNKKEHGGGIMLSVS